MEKLLYDFVERSQDILGDNLVGIYLHGSLAMGGFTPDKSDIDLIVVVNNPPSHDEKRKYLDTCHCYLSSHFISVSLPSE